MSKSSAPGDVETNSSLPIRHHPRLAFFYAVPIGALGGLIGLGGAEFRLPVLAGVLSYSVSTLR